MVFQVFVRDLSGDSHCLQLDADSTTRREILHRLGYSSCSSELSLQTGTRLLSAECVITAGRDGFFPSCHVSCRLLGGKGGFGSLLRGAATRAGQKKTSNFDACRDMSGRRLRHVNAEKKLKEWRHESKERRLEKVAEDYIKKLAKEKKKVEVAAAIAGDLKVTSADTMDRVAEAVKLGMREFQRKAVEKKRKRSQLGGKEAGESKGKKAALGLGAGPALEHSTEGEESEEEDGVEEEEEGSSDESSDDDEEEDEEGEDEEEEEVTEDKADPGQAENAKESRQVKESHERPGKALEKQGAGGEAGLRKGGSLLDGERSLEDRSSAAVRTDGGATLPKLEKDKPSASSCEGKSGSASPEPPSQQSVEKAALDWDKVSSSGDLEALGMEGLKAELSKHGLKCGGTLPERASRLFLLKDTALEKLDKKHFAKAPARKL